MLGYLIGWPGDVRAPSYTASGPSTVTNRPSLRDLQERVNALELALAAVCTLLKQKSGFTDDEIAKLMIAIDERDGKADGKITHPPMDCPNCGRKILTRSKRHCLWCGSRFAKPPG